MDLNSETEFPSLDACLKSPHHIRNATTPSVSLDSSLNPEAHVFTPRSSIIFNDCPETSTPEQVPNIYVELVGDESRMSAFGDVPLSENISPNLSKSKTRSNKVYGAGKKLVGGKRRLSMTSIANMSVSSMDTNVSDSIENETDPAVLARREKNISYGKNTDTYAKYIQVIPKQNRVKGSPRTPIKEMRYSRRQWDGLIKHWKINLHDWERGTTGTPSKPTFSTPKRAKTKCDRRSMGNTTPIAPSDRTLGSMLPPSISMMFSKENEHNENKVGEQLDDVLDWGQYVRSERIMDWSKECETSEDESEHEANEPTQLDSQNNDVPSNFKSSESANMQNDENIIPSCSKEGNTSNLDDQLPSDKKNEDEGKVFKCVSLVDAISSFDNETYKEEEDKDYVPKYVRSEERGIRLQELGLDESDDDSEPETLFYQVVQRNKPFRPRKN